ncbi:carboxylesterase family domain-containing protein [Phthorimaea operculella]|nr:carboxylesterase family domain-containing protein [Phthorimaea operculella]
MYVEMVLFCSLLILITLVSADRTLVQTTTGPIKGTYIDSFGVKYFAFQGIPYAEKPIGDLRFKPPIPKVPWSEELDASHPGRVCPQTAGAYKKEEMDEDCLFINVFVPASKEDRPLPVFFFIHGGEFKALTGNANNVYGPQLLLRHDIIIVTFNYRLGALGFLSLENEEASGNAGLKDMVLALQWFYDNADRFGGDRNRITIGGNSAGSVATQYLVLSPKPVGLFHQAIQISGSALGYRFLTRHPKEIAITLAEELGIQFTSPQELLEKLKEADAFDIVEAQENIGKHNKRNGFRPFAPFVPCIEPEHPDAFITKEPRTILEEGVPNNVPLLVGFNSDEGLKMYSPLINNRQLIDYLNEDFQLCIPSDIGYPKDSEESKQLSKSIQKFYFNDAEISDDTMQQLINLITDTMFAHGIDYAMKLHKSRPDSNKLFYYEFAFDGQLNMLKIGNKIDRPGTAHADELGYLFVSNTTKSRLCDLDARSHHMLDIMTEVMANFVKFGNPTPTINNIGIEWKEAGEERSHLYIDEQLLYKTGPPIPERLQFWDDAYQQFYEYAENGGEVEYSAIP